MMKVPERTISSRSRISPTPMPRLEKEKGKATVDAQPAEEREKKRVRTGENLRAVHIHEHVLIPREPIRAEIRLRIIDQNALLSAEANARIAQKIANAATRLWMRKISRSVMRGRRNAIGKATCPMPCHQ